MLEHHVANRRVRSLIARGPFFFWYDRDMQPIRILSIDPGYERLGIAIVEKEGNQKEVLTYSDCFKTSAKLNFIERLKLVGDELTRVINDFEPQAFAIEKLYFNTNQKTATNVSEVRGALIFIALSNNLTVYESTPLQIKTAITGDGRSDKSRMMWMVPKLINIDKEIKHDDEYDAIAVGLTCFASEKF